MVQPRSHICRIKLEADPSECQIDIIDSCFAFLVLANYFLPYKAKVVIGECTDLLLPYNFSPNALHSTK